MQMDDITKKTFKCIFTLFHTGKGEMLNNFNPIEKYVWTYIVAIPNEYGNEK